MLSFYNFEEFLAIKTNIHSKRKEIQICKYETGIYQ